MSEMQDAGLHGIYPPRCGVVGALTVGGRVVGQLRCDLEVGHDERVLVGLGEVIPGGYRRPEGEWHGTKRYYPATPHAATLTWTPEAEPDLDLFDPDEVMVDPMPIEKCPGPDAERHGRHAYCDPRLGCIVGPDGA